LLAQGDFSRQSGHAAAPLLLDAGATAIIASNDQMTLGALEVARARGLAVPADISLVSFDDTPIARFNHPPLTAVTQPIAHVTARAVELIIAERGGQDVPEGPVVVAPALTVRESTGPRRR
jgi:LacI family transcriptional regulator